MTDVFNEITVDVEIDLPSELFCDDRLGYKHLQGQHDQSSHGHGSYTTPAGEELYRASRDENKVWRMEDGSEAPEHIQKLGIPPGWSDVLVNPDPEGDVMARGIDSKGRVQMRYSESHAMKAAAEKFGRISELRQKKQEIMREIDDDIVSGDERTREDALAMKLIAETGMRPGSATDDTKADYKSYGATTLEGRHIVQKDDGTIVAKFVSGKKKGQEIEMPIQDPQLGQMLLKRSQEVGPDGRLFQTTEKRLRVYSKSKDGGGFKVKDFRTAIGTETAIERIKSMPKPKTMKEYRKATKEVSTQVSEVLGNTPSVAMKSYIDPNVWTEWRAAAERGKRKMTCVLEKG